MPGTAPPEVGRPEVGRPEIGRRIVVPVVNPASAAPLLRCATRLAHADGGRVELVTVMRPDASAADHDRAMAGLEAGCASGDHGGVAVHGRVVAADDPASGVLDAVAEADASLVLMGWRGGSSNTDVFGRLIDHVVGRSTAPLAIVRGGRVPFRRVVLPLSADHLLPGGAGGLGLAVALAGRLRATTTEPTTLLRTGPREVELPPELLALGDRVHHDPRRTDQAVGASARPHDLVVAAVAPTVTGLRAATTHLAWAAPEATLMVAVDAGRRREPGLQRAVEGAGEPAPRPAPRGARDVRIVVTARLPDDRTVTPGHLDRVLRQVGVSRDLMAWWPSIDPRPHVRATVTVRAAGVNDAIGALIDAVDHAPALRGAEVTYDVDRGPRADADVPLPDLSLVEDGTEATGARV